ncbi:MAG TPA: hypothetical protein VFY13_06145, partial [Luteolibacter sp.]|nr:hypothetical protein [Luteolibacter sp.]
RSRLTKSLREIGDYQVTEWELPEFLRKDITELEIRQSLQHLAKLQVTEWELKDVMPAILRFAQKEVDVVGALKRTADYKVADWDIREALLKSRAKRISLNNQELRDVAERITKFLEFMIQELVDEPRYVSLQVDEISTQVLRFRIIVKRSDLPLLIGMKGQISSPIRHIVKDTALHHGVQALLEILSDEEAARQSQTPSGGR